MAPFIHQDSQGDILNQGSPQTEEYYSGGLRARFRIDALKTLVLKDHSGPYADIKYEVDEAKFRARSAARIQAGGLETEPPAGWPKVVHGPLVWFSNSFQDESELIYYLTEEDQKEIGTALEYFKEQDLNGEDVSKETFPLPNLAAEMERLCVQVYDGRGFGIIRGLDTHTYTVEDLTVIYLGLGSHVAERRGKQDQRGSMLMHVVKPHNSKGDQYSEDKPFHTDTVTDCLCLFTRSLSEKGGRNVIASSWTVYNELAATRPDLIHVLARPDWPFDTYGRNPPYYKRAVLYYHHGKIIFSFSRRLLVGHLPHEPRTEGIPGLTEAQAEALDAVHFIARRHEVKISMQQGDLRFINNMAILHRREAFEDSVTDHRHLVRIWLNNELMCWKLPRPLQLAWARVFEDERVGHWDIEPPMKDGVLLRVAGTCD